MFIFATGLPRRVARMVKPAASEAAARETPRTHEPPTYYYYLTLCVRLGPPWGRCMHDMHTKGMVVGNSEASPTRPLSGGALTL